MKFQIFMFKVRDLHQTYANIRVIVLRNIKLKILYVCRCILITARVQLYNIEMFNNKQANNKLINFKCAKQSTKKSIKHIFIQE